MRSAGIGALLLVLLLSLTVTDVTRGDVVINFDLNFSNTPGNPGQSLEIPSGQVVGTLTAIQADFVMTAQDGGVFVSDLAVFVSNLDTISPDGGGLLQVGGWSDVWGASEFREWGTGDNSNLNERLEATITLNTPIVFNGDSSDPNVFIANLYDFETTSSFNGSFTLVGLSAVPEPNSLAFLAMASLAISARRRRN